MTYKNNLLSLNIFFYFPSNLLAIFFLDFLGIKCSVDKFFKIYLFFFIFRVKKQEIKDINF